MARRTTTVTESVDVDGDGDLDTVTTIVTLEDEEVTPVVTPTPRAGTPGACGETACWQRKVLTFTSSNVGRVYTFTPAWSGNVAWDFGDGTPVVVGRGPVTHTYATPGAKSVTATPLSSAGMKAGAPTVITVV